MKKIILTSLAIFSLSISFAQDAEKENLKKTEEALKSGSTDRPNGWLKKGTFNALLTQSTFDNWLAGGQNNITGNIGLNYDFNFKSNKWSWDNKLIVGYGLTKIKDAETQKTDDRIELTSLAGRKAGAGYWYYSGFVNFKTQMDSGFLKTPLGNIKNSHFFSPAFLQFGPGMLWKKSDNLKVNIAPATSKLVIVNKQFTEFGESFGVKKGETLRYEFGAALNGYYKFNLMENVSVENILNLYSNYLDKPQNVDIDYQLNIAMKINKYLTTNFAFQTIYDDNTLTRFQTRQVIGIGLDYKF